MYRTSMNNQLKEVRTRQEKTAQDLLSLDTIERLVLCFTIPFKTNVSSIKHSVDVLAVRLGGS